MKLTYHIDDFKDGRGLDLLVSVTLSYAAEQRGIKLVCEDLTDARQAIKFWLAVIYSAALNWWDLMSLTQDMGEFPYTIVDIAEWQTSHVAEYIELQVWAAKAMAGLAKEHGEAAKDVKKKRS